MLTPNTVTVIMETSIKVPLILGNPHISQERQGFTSLIRGVFEVLDAIALQGIFKDDV